MERITLKITSNALSRLVVWFVCSLLLLFSRIIICQLESWFLCYDYRSLHPPWSGSRGVRVHHARLLQVRKNWKKVSEFEWSGKGQGKNCWKSEKSQGKWKIGATMSDFQAKVHQIWFPLELRPRPHSASLQCAPRPPTYT